MLIVFRVEDEGENTWISAFPDQRITTLENNRKHVLRETAACFAAAVGGANSFTGHSYGYRSRHLQHILREEAQLAKVADPGRGSFYIESLTEKLVERVHRELPQLALPPFAAVPEPFESRWNGREPRPCDTMPGTAPFVRGPYTTMYREKPWTIRQYAGFATAEESNAFYRRALENGQNALSIAFDLPTQRGYDSDDSEVQGDVGTTGVAIDSVEDMQRLFAGIELDKVSVSMTMNGAVLPILALFIVTAEEQGISQEVLRGTIQNDFLKEFVVRNAYIYPPKFSMRIAIDVVDYLGKHLPSFHGLSVSGYHMHEAGASAELELAYAIANGISYVKAGVERGLPVDSFASRISFFWAAGMDFFKEVAKLRAARFLWAKHMQKFSPKDPRSLALRAHVQTSGSSLTAQLPQNNIVRTCVEAMAATHGQAQSLHTNAYDEALALPSDQAARVARATHHMLLEESGVTRTVDPWAGSRLVEEITEDLIERVDECLIDIERRGGMLALVDSGEAKQSIEEEAVRDWVRLDRGDKVVVGVNKYKESSEKSLRLRCIESEMIREEQSKRLSALRRSRNQQEVDSSLRAIEVAAKNPDVNLVPFFLRAARARATVGEMTQALAEVFGRYEAPTERLESLSEVSVLGNSSLEQGVQRLVLDFRRRQGCAPRMLLVKLGQDGHDRALRVVAEVYQRLGFEVHRSPLFRSPEKAARDCRALGAHIVAISSLAASHSTLVPAFCKILIGETMFKPVIVVGGVIPKDDHLPLFDSGVDAIYLPGTDLVQAAHDILQRLLNSVECCSANAFPNIV